jgi:hypothetical protein
MVAAQGKAKVTRISNERCCRADSSEDMPDRSVLRYYQDTGWNAAVDERRTYLEGDAKAMWLRGWAAKRRVSGSGSICGRGRVACGVQVLAPKSETTTPQR